MNENNSQTSMEDNVLSNGKKLNMIYKQDCWTMLYDTCSGTNIESKKWIQKHFVTNCKIFGELPQRTEQVFMHRK